MTSDTPLLKTVFEGWDTYHLSIVHAVAPLTAEQLLFRPAENQRTTGEIASHIGLGRIDWFVRMDAPGSHALAEQVKALEDPKAVARSATEIVYWLEASWNMIEKTLATWTVADLSITYRHTYWGKTYAVSRQWTLWRILAHDLHHGGELALTLGLQGIAVPELGDLGGHLNEPPLAE